jgi:hypothetical protein
MLKPAAAVRGLLSEFSYFRKSYGELAARLRGCQQKPGFSR